MCSDRLFHWQSQVQCIQTVTPSPPPHTQRHADPLLLNCKSESALDLAAQYGHIDTVHLLISHCPEMLFIQRAQFSPLHLAARNGHTVVALSLINAGISVNTVVSRGWCIKIV